jgi:hypothetical protein
MVVVARGCGADRSMTALENAGAGEEKTKTHKTECTKHTYRRQDIVVLGNPRDFGAAVGGQASASGS